MARLIDAESLLNQYELIDWYSVSKKGQLVSGATTEDNPFIHYYDGEEIIKNAPTIEAVPVRHGRWVWRNKCEPFEFKYECSICHDGSDLESKYCQNCGARMDGGADNG